MKSNELLARACERRILPLMGEVNPKQVEPLKQLLFALNLESTEPITLLVDSIGGEIDAGLQFYDFLKSFPAPLTGVVIGRCYSIALAILLACSKRLATQNSTFHLHTVRMEILYRVGDGKDPAKKALLRGLKKSQTLVDRILLKNTNLTPKLLKKMLDNGNSNETPFLAQHAKTLGIIHEVAPDDFKLF